MAVLPFPCVAFTCKINRKFLRHGFQSKGGPRNAECAAPHFFAACRSARPPGIVPCRFCHKRIAEFRKKTFRIRAVSHGIDHELKTASLFRCNEKFIAIVLINRCIPLRLRRFQGSHCRFPVDETDIKRLVVISQPHIRFRIRQRCLPDDFITVEAVQYRRILPCSGISVN